MAVRSQDERHAVEISSPPHGGAGGHRSRFDGVTGREPWWTTGPATLTRENVWNRAISFTIFLQAAMVARIGAFDERLGLPKSSGEEIDYLIRALAAGARIEYDPSISVRHDATPRPLARLGARDGASVGVILRKHRYPPQTVARMFLRDRVNIGVTAFYIMSTVCGIWLSMSVKAHWVLLGPADVNENVA